VTAELIRYITQHGYLAIFGLVFLQELGIPNPVPNEFILLFAGYQTYIGALSLPLAVFTAIGADFIGTSILYFIFYYFGYTLIRKKPKWLPINREKIEKIKGVITKRDLWGIYIGRLIPYVRGYTSVAAGLIQIEPKKFLIMVFLSAVTWSGGYVIIGHFIGPRWQMAVDEVGGIRNALVGFIILASVGFAIFHVRRHLKNRKNSKQ
jgi:membrane protein DedA with SNARE-associated domain